MTTIAPSASLILGAVLSLATSGFLGFLIVRWTRLSRKSRSR
jgi:hypothetical protein